jgi:hypothetical protein
MKKLVFFVFLFASFQAFGQFPNYTNINGRYKWIAGKFDSTFTIPSGTTPSLRTGGGTGPGALFYRTTDSTVYQYTGTQWIKLRAGVSPTDTAGIWISNVYRQTGTDSVFYVKGGTSTFAFRDSIGNVGGGGGGGKIYYFNGGVNLGTFAGLTMYELGDTAVTSAAANFTRSTTGNLANFITDVNRPGLLQIPAGVWTVDAYLSETGGGSNHAEIWIEVEKWDGSTITTIATSPIEQITNGNVIDLYTWGVSIPTTTLTVTDRIIIQFYISNTNGKTVTLYTQNGYVGEVHTTFTTGIGSLNGLTAPTQYFATGTSGTDFAISSSTATHTFNLPTASGSNRGALSSADWTTFNGKVGGSGTTNYVPKWTSSTALGNSLIQDDGTNVGINTTPSTYRLNVNGTIYSNNALWLNSGNALSLKISASGGDATNGSTGFAFRIENNANSGNLTIIPTEANARAAIYATNPIWFRKNVLMFNQTFEVSDASVVTKFIISPTNGNTVIGGSTLAGFMLDVQGTFRSTLDANINGLTVGKGGASGAGNTVLGSPSIGVTTGTNNTIIGQGITGLSSSLSNTIILADGQGNQRIVVNSSNQIGLGGQPVAPYPVHINAVSGYGLAVRNTTTTTKLTQVNDGSIVLGDGSGNYATIENVGTSGLLRYSSALHQFRIGSTNSIYIPASANVLIGTTTDAGYKLDVNGTARVQGGSAVASVIENSGTNAGLRITNSTYPYIVFNRAGTVAKSFGIFNASGDMAIQESTGWSGANSHIFYGGGGFSTIGSGTFGNNVAANASAVLEATSTTKGFLPPRMTNAEMVAIATPAAGLVVYDTTNNKLNVYDGTNWVAVH